MKKKEKIDKISRYWIEHSDYDFVTAEAMLKTKRYLYVCFMCQQAVEKLLKAVITFKVKIVPPRTHDLSKLSVIAEINNDLAERQREFLVMLTPFCILARYAGYKKKLSELSNARLAKTTLKETRVFLEWLKETEIQAR